MFKRVAYTSLLALLAAPPALCAQVTMQTPEPPAVTAETLDWFQSGEPIFHSGGVFHKTGAVTHFNRNEMVPSGWFGEVPIYVRTTEEPGSVVYVPLAGGLMQPYERRRRGDLAGTVGSSAPGFPVVLPAQEEAGQAPPRVQFARVPPALEIEQAPVPVAVGSAYSAGIPEAVGTSGALASRPGAGPLTTARRPTGLNGVYLEFEGTRFFADGTAVELTAGRFTRIGEHRGFPVYEGPGQKGVIYVSLLAGAPGLVTPYRTR